MKIRQHLIAGIIAIVTTGLANPPGATAGKIDDTRDDVRGCRSCSSKKRSSSKSSSRSSGKSVSWSRHSGDSDASDHDYHHHHHHSGYHHHYGEADDDDAHVMMLPLAAVAYVMAAPFVLPHYSVERGWGKRDGWRRGEFPARPYASGFKGSMSIDNDSLTLEKSSQLDEMGARPISMRLALEYAADLDGVHRPAGYFVLDTTLRLGLESGWSHYMEVDNGEIDRLTLGDINLMFRFAQNEYVQFRMGVGPRFFMGEGVTAVGFNFTYGMDIFPVKPLTIGLHGDLGNAGYAGLAHGRITVGVVLGPVELYAGWDALAIGKTRYNGPVGGLRAWF